MSDRINIESILAQRRGTQTFGPLRINWYLTADCFSIDVRVFLSGQLVDLGTLSRQQPNMKVDVKQGNESAKGNLSATFSTRGQAQLLEASLHWCHREHCQSFEGIIANFGDR